MSAESDNAEDARTLRSFVKHAETLLAAVITIIILWLGNTTYQNSLILVKVNTQMETLVTDISTRTSANADDINELSQRLDAQIRRVDGHFDTIWPRLREIKERLQHLESTQPDTDARARTPWRY